jgi:hypothetical protein
MHRLSVKLMTVTFALWSAVMFVGCVVYGLLFPAFHASWLLENVLPGFSWLTPGAFFLGVVETFLYGAGAGFVFCVLYNWLLPRLAPATTGPGR